VLRTELSRNDFADDASGARRAAEAHAEAKRAVLNVPVEDADNAGQRLLQRCVRISFAFESFISLLGTSIAQHYSIDLLKKLMNHMGIAIQST